MYTVKITFKFNYSGSKTLIYKIFPKAVVGRKNAKSAKTVITLSWSKAAGAKNYDEYSLSDGKTFKLSLVSLSGLLFADFFLSICLHYNKYCDKIM